MNCQWVSDNRVCGFFFGGGGGGGLRLIRFKTQNQNL
jgi:hypothetical protein